MWGMRFCFVGWGGGGKGVGEGECGGRGRGCMLGGWEKGGRQGVRDTEQGSDMADGGFASTMD